MYSDPGGQTWKKYLHECSIGLRYSLTVILLVIVWKHSHWSVALCITLLSITVEIENEAKRMRRKTDKQLNETLMKLSQVFQTTKPVSFTKDQVL